MIVCNDRIFLIESLSVVHWLWTALKVSRYFPIFLASDVRWTSQHTSWMIHFLLCFKYKKNHVSEKSWESSWKLIFCLHKISNVSLAKRFVSYPKFYVLVWRKRWISPGIFISLVSNLLSRLRYFYFQVAISTAKVVEYLSCKNQHSKSTSRATAAGSATNTGVLSVERSSLTRKCGRWLDIWKAVNHSKRTWTLKQQRVKFNMQMKISEVRITRKNWVTWKTLVQLCLFCHHVTWHIPQE